MIIYSRTEDYIRRLLTEVGIHTPHELKIKTLSNALGISVYFWEFSSESVCKGGRNLIFLNKAKNKQTQWQEFTHEIAHNLWHAGRQEHMPHLFVELQEWQAKYFSYHLCIPTFMLQQIGMVSPYQMMELFNVEYDFACHRLEMYENKLLHDSKKPFTLKDNQF
ncbi:ImmA/IrrE family metallo-endopeptidase [Virgibacillus salexigens]|uniref:ImmA/IrrE family metallo-endopeptidase n=1 Tax=Virgibacillus salexigens TaxID=61016 RepID=UPI001909B2E2|nr:ImmA/IrrE family metallo-endopeptidase [Virgibacillus salexigens]